ncbi:MAG: biotin--[acetyl-CoA-carboxylase] ligase [Akkermansiaceae bacterium]|nr:biotin--[acetyl-CoA-carboxylase] ligase [Akkermansiaceae bacterium]
MDEFSAIAPDLPEPFRLLIKQTVDSTNDEVRRLAEQGMPEGLVVITDRQTQGRGRRGAAWFSPPGESLAFSVLLRPDAPKALWPRLALVTGLAVAEALEESIPLVGIKWPNDVWAGGKKIAGILVEAGRDFVVVGIGLNVNTLTFPDEVSAIATSLALEAGGEVSRAEVLAAIIRRLSLRRHQIGTEFPEAINSIRLRCVLTGQEVSLTAASGPLSGTVEGISPQGELLLRTSDGLQPLLQADEVRITGSGKSPF